jgi:hypothetical protein
VELEKREDTQQVFQKWMLDGETKDMVDRWLPRKLTVLGLLPVLAIPAASLPVPIQRLLLSLINLMICMTIFLKTDSECGEAGAHDDGNFADDTEEEEDIGYVDQGFGEDEDGTKEVDGSYRKALQGVTTWDDDMAKFLLGGDWDNSEDIDEDSTSPLD